MQDENLENENFDYHHEENEEKRLSQEFGNSGLDVYKISDAVERIKDEIQKVVVGQDITIDLLLAGIFANGHILMEGVFLKS